MTVVVERQK